MNHNTHVFADVNMVETIFRNLVSNAIKFTNENGLIKITSKDMNGFEEISISDNGIGILESDIEKILNSGIQHSASGTENEKGTGLGLILCREFVEKNGGKIWVESEVNNGTIFKFTLPKKTYDS